MTLDTHLCSPPAHVFMYAHVYTQVYTHQHHQGMPCLIFMLLVSSSPLFWDVTTMWDVLFFRLPLCICWCIYLLSNTGDETQGLTHAMEISYHFLFLQYDSDHLSSGSHMRQNDTIDMMMPTGE